MAQKDGRSKTSAENGRKGGRPVSTATRLAQQAREYIAQETAKHLAPIVSKAIEQAKEGDKHAREWLADRGFGKATQFMMTRDEEGNEKEVTSLVIMAKQALDELPTVDADQ